MALLPARLDGAGKTGPSRGHGGLCWVREADERHNRVRRARANPKQYMMCAG
jgi:hypothetical protein